LWVYLVRAPVPMGEVNGAQQSLSLQVRMFGQRVSQPHLKFALRLYHAFPAATSKRIIGFNQLLQVRIHSRKTSARSFSAPPASMGAWM